MPGGMRPFQASEIRLLVGRKLLRARDRSRPANGHQSKLLRKTVSNAAFCILYRFRPKFSARHAMESAEFRRVVID